MSTVEQGHTLRARGPGRSNPYDPRAHIAPPRADREAVTVDFRPLHPDEGDGDPEQLELFLGEQLSATWKPREDLNSLEFPLFSLQKGKDTRLRTYQNESQIVRIIPSGIGAANIFDKDLLVYAATLICKAADDDRPISRRIRFKVRDFLNYTNRSTGGASYQRILDSCRRLKGTIIETNFDSVRGDANENGVHATLQGYGLIEQYKIVAYTANKLGALEVELVISTWTYDLLKNRRVLTIHPKYFKLGQGLERRLYDLAKKHCGEKLWFKIGLDKLHSKSGSAQALKFFRRDVVAAIAADQLPEFHIALDDAKAMVIFFRCDRDNARQDAQLLASIHRELVAKKLTNWFYSLRRWDSKADPKQQFELLPN